MFLRARAQPENLNYAAYAKIISRLCMNQVISKSGAGAISLDAQFRAISLENNIPVKFLDEGVDLNKVAENTKPNVNTNAEFVNKAVSNFDSCVSGILTFINSYRKGNYEPRAIRQRND